MFALELTHDFNVLLPLLLAVTIAHGFTVLTLRRSILTEKVSRRGFHLSREYAVDPLEILFAREVMRTGIVALPADAKWPEVATALASRRPADRPDRPGPLLGRHDQRLFPIVDANRRLAGVVTRSRVRDWIEHAKQHGGRAVGRHRARGPGGRVRRRAAARPGLSDGRNRRHAPAGDQAARSDARRDDRVERSAHRTRPHPRSRAEARTRPRVGNQTACLGTSQTSGLTSVAATRAALAAAPSGA